MIWPDRMQRHPKDKLPNNHNTLRSHTQGLKQFIIQRRYKTVNMGLGGRVSESATEEDWNICSCYSDGVRSYRMRPTAPLIGPSCPWLPQPAPPGP